MLTTGKDTHYCVHCGFDIGPKTVRMCVACDGDLCEPKKRTTTKRRVVMTTSTGYAVKVWPVKGDPRHSWLTSNGGYVISVFDRGVWGSKSEAKEAYRPWAGMGMKLVRVRFNEVRLVTP